MDSKFMKEAIRLSREAIGAKNGGPFGAVVVKDGRVVGKGRNQVTLCNDPTAHAEVTAIRDACSNLDHFSLEGCALYTSSEPCPMCLSAIYWSRLDKVYFANTYTDAAHIGFDDQFIYEQLGMEHDSKSIKLERLDDQEVLKDALDVFSKWDESEEKIPY